MGTNCVACLKGKQHRASFPTTPNTRIHKDHPIKNVIGDVKSSVRHEMTKLLNEQGFISTYYKEKSHDTLTTCLYTCFLSQIEPTSIAKALSDSSWVKAMQEELLQFKLQQTRKVEKMDYALGIKQGWLHRGHRQEEGIDYEEVFAHVARIEAIRLPKVYKVVKALYGLHQAPRAWYETLANYLLGNGFKRGKIDQTLFIKKQKEDILLVQMSSMGREELTFFQGYKLLAEEDVDLEKLYVKDWSNATDVDGKPQQDDTGFIDSGCSRHMTGNIAYLLDFKKFDGGYVTFRGGAHGGKSKGGRYTKVPQSSGPLVKVGDEVVHKELGDRIKRVATAASSLETEKESVTAAELLTTFRHHLVLPVQVNAAEGDFKNTLIQAKAKSVNGERQLQALVDKKKVSITKTSIRSDFHLEDAGGTDCLLTATIFEELARMGTTAWNKFSSTMATAIICLATYQKFNFSKYIFNTMKKQSRRKQRKETKVPQDETYHDDSVPIPSNDPLFNSEDRMQLTELMILCTNLQKQVLILEKAKDAELKNRKRDVCIKTERVICFESIDKDAKVSLVDETQRRSDDAEIFDTDDLYGDEVIVDMAVGEKQEQSAKVDEREVSTGVENIDAPTIPVTTTGEGVSATKIDEIITTSAPTTAIDEITLAQTLIEIKAAKPKVVTTAATTTTTTRPNAGGVVVQEPSEFRTTTSSPQASQPLKTKDKGKAIMIESEVPLKKKNQVALDEEMARNLKAQLLLAERLQTREQEELTDEEKAKLFMEFIEKRRKHFAALRAHKKRNRPPTKTQKRNQISIYLKHMGGYKHNQLKGKSNDEIQKLFDNEKKRVNSFVAMNSEAQEISGKKDESSSKKAEITQDSSAKRAGVIT
ncbi:putative ribonuclease H-like domain-containing protein, partial [Tanacetum coccineum]